MIINSKIYNIPDSYNESLLNEKTRLVVFSNVLTDIEEGLLKKMVVATGLSDNEFIHIVSNNPLNSVNIFANHQNNLKIISFGIPSSKIGLQVQVKKYQVFSIRNMDIVIVDKLEIISEEVNLKKYIWNVFKAWFIDEK